MVASDVFKTAICANVGLLSVGAGACACGDRLRALSLAVAQEATAALEKEAISTPGATPALSG
jgi:hypothetical protein